MTPAMIWEGCNYQNENFQMGSLIKGRGTVIFLRALSAPIQAMHYCVPHERDNAAWLSCASMGWQQTEGEREVVLRPCTQLKTMVKSWPKGKFKIRKSKAGKRENGKEKSLSHNWLYRFFFFFNLGEIQSLETFFHSFANGCIVTA